ncbi:M-phase phosphoprotein 8 [Discoglossus pictus]
MADVAGSDTTAANLKRRDSASKEAAMEETGDSAVRAETGGDSEDEEDVFEVESILDSKTEGGEVLYKVRWKGYDSDGDTWEPEAHLDDCKEVLLEFRRKLAENKQKQAKKDLPKVSLSDVFDAESDIEPPRDQKEASPHRKKKKSSKDEEEDKSLEELKKKKSKSGRSRERSRSDAESSGNQSPEPKPKKRTSESKEDLINKKQKKEDVKEPKKMKKEELKIKGKEENKEKDKEKKLKKERLTEIEQNVQSPESVSESVNVNAEALLEEKNQDQGNKNQEDSPVLAEEHLSESLCMDEDTEEIKMKKKKKKHKKTKTDKVEESMVTQTEVQVEKKIVLKKQKPVEKVKETPAVEKTPSTPAPIQKISKPSVEEKARRSTDSLTEEKVTRKTDVVKEKPRKKHDIEKEGKKEQKIIKPSKETKPTSDAFKISAEDRTETKEKENLRKREETSYDHRPVEDNKSKETKTVFKERRSTKDDTDPWPCTASEGDQEVIDSACHMQDNSAALESKTQVIGLGMDLQLEWMTLEDFQKHLDGSDEILPTETVSSSALKDAVKNGDYMTVKFALSSTEEYNLDQEDSSGMTLVMMAAAAGQDDLLRLLIKKGAKINARQKNGTTALIHAAEKNYLTTVALLLEAGAHVNVQQTSGETALMKACKRGNYDIARLLIEYGSDCNILSKHQSSVLQFAKQSNNALLFELIKSHLETLSRVAEDAIRDYFETRLVILEPVFPIACHRLSDGPDFSLDFNYKPPYNIPEGSGILMFVFHANFFGKEVVVRLCGPCSVQAVVLNDKFQLPVFLDAHFIYSFSPVTGHNKLFVRLSEVPTAKVKLLICAYRVQLQ